MAWELDEPDAAGGSWLDPKVIVGHLLIVWAVKYIEHAPTQHSKPGQKSDVVVVDGVDLDQINDQGEEGVIGRNSWWRQARLIKLLKTRVGNPNPILIRIQRVGNGFTSPYEGVSQRSDPAAMARYRHWCDAHPDFKPTSPDSEIAVPANVQATQQQQGFQEPLYRSTGGGNFAQHQVPETPLEAQARLAQGPPPSTSDVLSRLRGLGSQAVPQQEEPPF